MSRVRMSHVTRTKESCHIYLKKSRFKGAVRYMGLLDYMTFEGVMSHMAMSYVTHMNASCVAHVNESCHKRGQVLLHRRMSHVTRVHESCYTHGSCHTCG